MPGALEPAAGLSADLIHIVNLISAEPPDWSALTGHSRRHPTLITFVSPLSLAVVRRRPSYLNELSRFDHVYADSILVARMASVLREEPVPRRSFDGNSLAPQVFDLCRDRGLRVALVGGKAGVAEAAGRVFDDALGIRPILTAAGYFTGPAHRDEVQRRLRGSGADVVICGMGSGTQDRFLLDLADRGWRGLGFTCGGYLDQVVARGVRYYPEFVDRLHLRAVYRMLQEPLRLVPRYTQGYLPFYLASFHATMTRARASLSARAF